jgi:hypothetical protein
LPFIVSVVKVPMADANQQFLSHKYRCLSRIFHLFLKRTAGAGQGEKPLTRWESPGARLWRRIRAAWRQVGKKFIRPICGELLPIIGISANHNRGLLTVAPGPAGHP